MVFEHILCKRNVDVLLEEHCPIPGSSQANILDNVEFIRNPIQFIQFKVDQFGPVFAINLFGSKAICVAGQQQVQELLSKDEQLTAPGCYKQFLSDILGENLILQEGQEWEKLRRPLETALSKGSSVLSLHLLCPLVQRYVEQCFLNEKGSSVEVYKIFKSLAVDIMLSQLFLVESGNSSREKKLADDVYHGIQSVPINFSILGGFLQSGYARGKQAKQEMKDLILNLIETYRRKSSLGSDDPMKDEERGTILGRIIGMVQEGGNLSAEEASQQVILFSNSVLSKSIASVLTSFAIVMAQQPETRFLQLSQEIQKCYTGDQNMEYLTKKDTLLHGIVMEVLRLYPPVLGGCRGAVEDVQFVKYQLQKGHRALYNSYFANRDPAVFDDPQEFCPHRWQNLTTSDIFTFGGGKRACPGRHFSILVLKLVAAEMISYGLSWKLQPSTQTLVYKWLPVAKPAKDVKMVFRKDIQSI